MSLRFVVISEARADFTTATELADRVLSERIEWLDEEMLEHQRQWVGELPAGFHLYWQTISGRARELGIRVHGHFDGEPGLPDAQAARRAIAYVRRLLAPLDAIVLIRDTDDQLIRKQGLEQARNADSHARSIILGVAICERESWVVSGFQATNEHEVERLQQETQRLGWNPCLNSHQLTAGKDNTATKSPKRVLAALTGSEWPRERECWTDTPLATLRERGTENGLAEFLTEVADRLVPLITNPHRAR